MTTKPCSSRRVRTYLCCKWSFHAVYHHTCGMNGFAVHFGKPNMSTFAEVTCTKLIFQLL